MDISSINRQIGEYFTKMNTKVPRIKRKGVKLVPISVHLRKFYQNEIDKLEKQKAVILKQKEYTKTISWEEIKFEDFKIRVSVNNSLSESFSFQNSRSSYEFLKPYIKKANLKPLEVSILGNKICSISNTSELDTIIQILSVQEEIIKYFDNFQSTTVEKILTKLKLVSNESLLSFFKIKQKNLYLSFLCDKQCLDYRIVPTTEIQANKEIIISEEETFLFTVKSPVRLIIIWESSLVNKATYVFLTNESSYSSDIQKLFDFIASTQSLKRTKLRSSIKVQTNPFKSIAVLEHTSLETWATKLSRIISETP